MLRGWLLAVLLFALIRTAPGQEPLSVQDAIAAALSSPNAQIAEGGVGVAQGMLRQAGLGLNPRLYMQSEDLRPWANDFSFPEKTEDYGYVGQSFEIAGKRGKRVAVATANLHRAEAESVLRRRQIAAGVVAAYWSAVADGRIQVLLKQDLDAVDEMVRYHKARVDAGAMRGVDLIRMQIERDRILLSLQAAQRDTQMARIELARQMGRTLPKDSALTGDLGASQEVAPMDLAVALAQRQDIVVAQDAVQAAEADVRLQHAMGVPDPDLFAGYKRNSGADTAYLALQIPLPFRNRNQGEIVRAEAQLRIARASLEQAKIVARAEIDAAAEYYQRELAIVRQTLPDMRAHAHENLSILTEAYRLGEVDLLRYIDAERTNIDVEVTAIRTLSEFQQAVLRLQYAYGVQP